MSRHRSWCFTINNPTPEDARILDSFGNTGIPLRIKYMVWQHEVGDSRTPHIQGYVTFLDSIPFSRAKCVIGPRSHISVARGSAWDNRVYCTKDEGRVEGPYEYGTPPDPPSAAGRNGLTLRTLSESIEDGRIKTIEDVPVVFKIKYGIDRISAVLNSIRPSVIREVKVCVIIGSTGIGKSYFVHTHFTDIAEVVYGNCGTWVHGYVNQDVLLFDEFAGQVDFSIFLKLLDKYPVTFEGKGTMFRGSYSKVFILSNIPAEDWYLRVSDLQKQSLYRRIGKISISGVPSSGLCLDYTYTRMTVDEIRGDMETKISSFFGGGDDDDDGSEEG